MVRYRCAQSWRAVLSSSTELWNLTTAIWLPPHAYAPGAVAAACPEEAWRVADSQGALPSAPWERTAEALLDLLELGAELPEPPLPDPDRDHDEDDDGMLGEGTMMEGAMPPSRLHSQNTLASAGGPATAAGEKKSVGIMLLGEEPAESSGLDTAVVAADGLVKVDLDWAAKVVTFAMGCLVMAQRWTSVVDIGRRLNQLTLQDPSAAEASYPLMLHAQMALVTIARRKLGAIDARMAEHELKVEEAAIKRRNKYKHKTRTAHKVSGWGVYCYDFLLLPCTSYYS